MTQRQNPESDEPAKNLIDANHLQFAYATNSEWIRTADTKAGLQVAAAGLLLGLVTNGVTSKASVMYTPDGIVLFFVVVTYVFLVLAAVLDLIALGPRLRGDTPGSSPLYFRDVAVSTEAEYVARTRNESVESWRDEVAKQVYQLSRIASKKHRLVQWATCALLVAVVFGGVAWCIAGIW